MKFASPSKLFRYTIYRVSENKCKPTLLYFRRCTVMYENSVVLGGESVCQAEMNNTEYCTGGVVLHPCCVGLLGDCVVTTEENCTFHKGHWHPDKVMNHLSLACTALKSGTYVATSSRICFSIHWSSGAALTVNVGVWKVPTTRANTWSSSSSLLTSTIYSA